MQTEHNNHGGSCCSGGQKNQKPATAAQAIDPVCGMTVDPGSSAHVHHQGKDYYFCSAHCVKKFRETPEKYLDPKDEEPPKAEDAEAIYTCPMHPEVMADKPGACPQCGMELQVKS